MLEILKIQKYSKMLLDFSSWKDGSKEIKQDLKIIIAHLMSAIKSTKHCIIYEHTFD